MALRTKQVADIQSPTLSEKSPIFEDAPPAFAFPPMDYDRFRWRPSLQNSKLQIREVSGAELYEELWARLNHGEFTIFFGVDIKKIGTSIPKNTLIRNARKAWSQLRFAVPTLASQIDHDSEGRVLLTYKVADSIEEVNQWNAQTFSVEEDILDLDELRYKVGQIPIPIARGFQVYLRLVPRGDSFGLLLQTHHIVFDGAGIKALMNKYLRMLLDNLTEEVPAPKWGTEAKNLEPAMVSVLAEDQVLEGPAYQKTLGEILAGLAANQPHAHGLKDGKIASGNSRRVHYKFNDEESLALIRASKSKGFTINQIAHAALSMLAVEDSPRTAETDADAALLYFNLVNCRDRLSEPFKSSGYTSNCLAMHPVVVPLSTFDTVNNFKEAFVLTNTAELIKSQYERAKASPALASVVAQELELMLTPLLAAAGQAEKTGAKIPVPPTFGPWFSGDGIVETYLPSQVFDHSGNTTFDIQDVFISLNIVDPRPFFRLFTFKNEIILSVDHNENALPSETVDRLLARWTDIIRLVLQ